MVELDPAPPFALTFWKHPDVQLPALGPTTRPEELGTVLLQAGAEVVLRAK